VPAHAGRAGDGSSHAQRAAWRFALGRGVCGTISMAATLPLAQLTQQQLEFLLIVPSLDGQLLMLYS
jgi:hypothetical protein